jgi:hypothetical protein
MSDTLVCKLIELINNGRHVEHGRKPRTRIRRVDVGRLQQHVPCEECTHLDPCRVSVNSGGPAFCEYVED